jgi:hypothetical protein
LKVYDQSTTSEKRGGKVVSDYIYTIGPNGELYHHGVKGMKWGVRRYQNKDGSLTPAGKKRLSEKAGLYLNPPTKLVERINLVPGPVRYKRKPDGNIKNRNELSNHYQNAYDKLMRKHGINPEDGDAADLHYELEKRGKYQADDKLWNSYIDRYASATLKDLKFKESDEAKAYVKSLFEKDLIKIENQPVVKRKESIEEWKRRINEEQAFKKRIWAAQAESVSIRDSITSAIANKKYKTSEEKSKAADAAFRAKIRDAELAGNTLLANELQQQWAFSYDDHDWD